MGPKKNGVSRTVLTIKTKQEIIANVESGQKAADVARQYGLNRSTVCTILAKKDIINKTQAAKGVTKITSAKQRGAIHEEMETLLLVWINEREMKRDVTSMAIIQEKAREIFEKLKQQTPSSSFEELEFKATTGWFANFKRRTGIKNVIMHGESASADKEEADKYCLKFQEFIETEGYLPQQIFNCDETGLFWKRMPNRTYITKDEKSVPGHKPMKDRLTLLLGANASGDMKLKPLLVYHSENPRVFKQNSIIKRRLPVMWRSNQRAWVTLALFKEWLFEVCAPSIKDYLATNDLPLKALLLLDNAPGHPKDLDDNLMADFPWLTVQFLPPNTTSLIQPMDQEVIAGFKKLYTRALFRRCFEACQSSSTMILKTFWKEKFDILEAIHVIHKAWSEVTQRQLISAWRKLCPSFVQGDRGVQGDAPEIMAEILTTARDLELEVNEDDIEELIMEHKDELTTEDLQEILNEELQETRRNVSPSEQEEDERVQMPASDIKDLLNKWEDVRAMVLKWHPNQADVSRVGDLFDDNAINYFRKILKKREKQSTLDMFFQAP